MDFKYIIFERVGEIAIIKLNRPEVLNAINKDVLLELKEAIDEVERDESVRALIITGEGKAFVAGADIAWMRDRSPLEMKEFLELGKSVLDKIEKMSKPVIAAVNGYAFGGGCELALACDIRIASENARFGQQEINVGIMPGWGATQRLPKLISIGRAKELCLTGDVIDAREAERIGLVNKVVKYEELYQEALKLARKLASKPPIAVEFIKKAINSAMGAPQEVGMAYETKLCCMLWTTEDQKEGMSAFIEKREPKFKGK